MSKLKKSGIDFEFKRAFKLFITLIIILPILGFILTYIENFDDKRSKNDYPKKLNSPSSYVEPLNSRLITPEKTNYNYDSYNFNTKSDGASGGYDEGYEWASGEDIDDSSYCDDQSGSFAEGCRDYVMDMAEEDPEGYSY